MMQSEWVLGIDGGGSKTQAWIARRDTPTEDGVVGRGRADGSNPRTAGSVTAMHNIEQAVQAAFDDAKINRHRVCSACIGLAGADRKAEQLEIRNWAERIELARRVLVTNDAIPILYAANPDGVGVATVSGTGSLSLGRNAAEQTVRCGGWGPVLGDEGSGYAIARDGLRSAVRSADGRGPQSGLLDLFLAHLRLGSASELIPTIYCEGFGRAQIAELATIVFAADEAGDSVAGQIVQEAVDQLACTICTVARKLCFQDGGFLLSMSGGVLLNQARFRNRLVAELTDRAYAPEQVVLVREPVAGAVVLAASG